jgi:hypothetical protein
MEGAHSRATLFLISRSISTKGYVIWAFRFGTTVLVAVSRLIRHGICQVYTVKV